MGLCRFAKSRSTFDGSIEMGCSGCAAVRGASRGYLLPKRAVVYGRPACDHDCDAELCHLLLGRRLGQSPTTSIREVICDRSHNRDYLGRGAQASYRCPDRGRSRDWHRRVFEIPDQPLKQRCTKQGFSCTRSELDGYVNRYRAAQVPSDLKVHFLEYHWTVNHRKWAYVR
jgi:hypothetical protein